jgi:alginate O-acetyltransferase complex protein AlgI
MLFNSLDFAIFLPIVFVLYWFVTNKNLKLQNFLIVVASYLFYGWWDWRFLSLILFSTVLDYSIGLALQKQTNEVKRKWLIRGSVLVNLSFLGFFKYFNFFLDSFVHAFSLFGMEISAQSLNIILPVGISFYTFQSLSYTIDVYRKQLEPTKDFIAFAAFVCFFPQLVAGPIERAEKLLPQFYTKRTFQYGHAVDGLRQILWGLFKKMVIADNCAQYANLMFDNPDAYHGSSLLLGAVLFAFQIYGDFSGYSDIALGTARLFGFQLMRNFAFPYFSRDIAEFWRRWHVSLSTWFRDYVYVPLGGSRGGLWMKIRNTFIIFLVSGFWHGANWTFVIWGALHAFYFLPLLLFNRNRRYLESVAHDRPLPSVREFFAMLGTFLMTVLAWIFFRAESVAHAGNYLQKVFSKSLWMPLQDVPLYTMLLLLAFLMVEWIGREQQHALEKLGRNWHRSMRIGLYLLITIIVLWFSGEEQTFIYFQF